MKLEDLFQLIQSTLVREGFKLCQLTRNSMTDSHFVLNDEAQIKTVASTVADYKAIYGNSIEVRKCDHRNGAMADTSYYIAMTSWNCSSNKDLKRIKLMSSQTEPTLVKKIVKLANEYKDLLNEQKVNKLLDELM